MLTGSNRHEMYAAALKWRLEHVFRSLVFAIEIVQDCCVSGQKRFDVLYPCGAPTLVSPSNGCAPHP